MRSGSPLFRRVRVFTRGLFYALAWTGGFASMAVGEDIPRDMALIPSGEFTLPFRKDTAAIRVLVDSFYLDLHAVTHADYAIFVKEHPRFARSRMNRLFADSTYLRGWNTDEQPPPLSWNSPVTFVSWHAAREYCACRGKRLPSTAEWEFAAGAAAPGTDTAAFRRAILDWYARPSSELPPLIRSGTFHDRGVRDLFGVVWEWTSDFNAYGFTGMNQRGVEDSGAFCGAGNTRASRSADYSSTMRWAFRISLKPDYTVGSLGFRCARDLHGDSSLYQLDAQWRRDDGADMRLSELRGKVRILSMFFSHCAGICPMIVGQIKLLERELDPGMKDKVGFVLVTLDPGGDDSADLAAYRRKMNLGPDRWILLHGGNDDTRALANLLGVTYTPKPKNGQITHTGLIVLLDREGRAVEKTANLSDRKAFLKRIAETVAN